jgi:3-isopropylmalate/(R)-2-methylmalate dehydratase small subunit
MDDFRKTVLLEGLDDIGMSLKHEPDITAYEQRHRPQAALYEAVDSKQ